MAFAMQYMLMPPFGIVMEVQWVPSCPLFSAMNSSLQEPDPYNTGPESGYYRACSAPIGANPKAIKLLSEKLNMFIPRLSSYKLFLYGI